MTRNLNKTFFLKSGEITKKWYIVDAQDQVLGRLATKIATVLRGKHKPEFTPHLDMGDNVIVINADKVNVSGKKETDKTYHWHTLFPGGLKKRSYTEMKAKAPEKIIEKAVKGMLPKNKLAREQMKNLRVFIGTDHPHTSQKPEKLDI